MDERYSRQMMFTPIGKEGQRKLSKKHVLIVGAGALGTGNAEVLTRAGVGEITILDRDYIEWSNLHRQQLYVEGDAEQQIPKAVATKEQLQRINSKVKINAHVLDVTPYEIDFYSNGVDLILDATDNFETRMMMNDVSQKKKIPWIYGSCVGSYGISFTIIPQETPCLNCLLDSVPVGGLTCETAGIIGPTVNMVVVQQSTECLKILVEDWDALRNNLISFDLWTNEQSQIDVTKLKRSDCTSCGSVPTYPFISFGNTIKTAVLCGRDAVQISPPNREKRNLQKMTENLLKNRHKVAVNPFLLSLTTEEHRLVLFQDGRAIVHGTNDIVKAKTLYHRYFG